jgi:hypothetical protein
MQSKQIIASLFSNSFLTCFNMMGPGLGWAGLGWPSLAWAHKNKDKIF